MQTNAVQFPLHEIPRIVKFIVRKYIGRYQHCGGWGRWGLSGSLGWSLSFCCVLTKLFLTLL